MEDLDFKAFFNEKVRARGLTLKKLSDLSGIAVQHLENMSHGRYEKLPPAPYLRGYLRTLGHILDFDAQVWRDYFEESGIVRVSGERDRLPRNRFAVESFRRYALISILILTLCGYIVFRFSAIIGRPNLVVTNPNETIAQTRNDTYTVRGTANRSDGIMINGESVIPDEFGAWQKEIALQPGINVVEVKAKKFLGTEAIVTRQLIYEPIVVEDAPLTEQKEPATEESLEPSAE